MPQVQDPEKIRLFHDLLFGSASEQRAAMVQLEREGYSTAYLRAQMQKSTFYRNEFRSLVDPGGIVFKAIDLQQSKPDWLNLDRENPQSYICSAPSWSPKVQATAGTPYHRTINTFIRDKWVPLTGMGLTIVGGGAEMRLKVQQYDIFNEAVSRGKFIANWNGKRIWKLGFRGNQTVPAAVVQSERAAFFRSLKTMKLIKMGGEFTLFAGLYLSEREAARKNNAEAWSKFTLDVIMTGVAFIPVVGWVISGLYFLADTSAAIADEDWWHWTWEHLILPTGRSLKKASEAYNNSINSGVPYIIRNPLGW